MQISRGARGYTDKRFLEAMIRAAETVFPEAIFAVHLDHGNEEVCYDSIDSGFYSSVMIDASHEPFEKNIEITRRVVDRAHAKECVGRIDPTLDEPSMTLYLLRTFVLHVRRPEPRAASVAPGARERVALASREERKLEAEAASLTE